jgi:hypothetical protein
MSERLVRSVPLAEVDPVTEDPRRVFAELRRREQEKAASVRDH